MSSETTLQSTSVVSQLAGFFRALSQPTRIEILLAIGSGEACVCHLEAVLGQRQAYISQHLMALREADLITSRRAGRFVYYSLADDRLLPLIQSAAELLDLNVLELGAKIGSAPDICECPHCAPEANEEGS